MDDDRFQIIFFSQMTDKEPQIHRNKWWWAQLPRKILCHWMHVRYHYRSFWLQHNKETDAQRRNIFSSFIIIFLLANVRCIKLQNIIKNQTSFFYIYFLIYIYICMYAHMHVHMLSATAMHFYYQLIFSVSSFIDE